MIAHYLDPSAWVKRYFEEPGSSTIASIFADTELVCCSSIGIVEVAATISRKGRFEHLEPDSLAGLLAQAHADFDIFEQIVLTEEIVYSAESLAFDLGLRAGDALHLASAISVAHRDGIARIIMVSADKELLTAAGAKGLLTVNPAQLR